MLDGRLPKRWPHQLLDQARDEGAISEEEHELARRADAARERYLQVDAFDLSAHQKRGTTLVMSSFGRRSYAFGMTELPKIIEGGMGVAVSNWRLASRVHTPAGEA